MSSARPGVYFEQNFNAVKYYIGCLLGLHENARSLRKKEVYLVSVYRLLMKYSPLHNCSL